jgi:hypothetical protein
VPKQYTVNEQTERLGIALCDRIVTEMGHIWHEKKVDHGIDGEIELVDPASRGALNRVLWVQSKAQKADNKFLRENDRSFAYRCRAVDIEYWLSGTAPVLLVCSHPDTGDAWFKDVRAAFADPARRRERMVDFDKQADRFDASIAAKLLGLGVPAETGIYLRPPPRAETLTTNLLHVEHLAEAAYFAPTKARGRGDAMARLVRGGHTPASDIVLKDGLVYSFRRLDEPPLDALADGPPDRLAVDELATSKSEDDQRLLVWLMNGTLRELTHRDLRFHPERHYLYFRATSDLRERKVKAGPHARGRVVFRRYAPPDGATWTAYYRHLALDARFISLDVDWYLALNPTYHFTSDGREDCSFAGLLTKGIKQQEGHEAVRSTVKFWAHYLTASPSLFSGPPDSRLRFGRLATVDVAEGIDDAAWKPRRGDAAPDCEADDLRLFEKEW